MAVPGVLRERNFRRYYLGQAASLVGDGVVNLAIAFAVIEIGGDASDIGIVFAARVAALVACLLGGGVLADRISRRTIMIVTDVVRFLSQGALAALMLTGVAEIWTLAVLSAVTGAAAGFFSPAMTGIMTALVRPDQLQEANGLRAIAMAVGEIGGPVVAGVLVAALGAGWALSIDAATFLVSAVLLLGVRVPPVAERARQTFVADLREGWQAFRSRAWVWSFVSAAALGNLLFASWQVLGPIVAERELGGAATWGLVVGALGAGSLLGSVVSLRARPRRPMVFATVALTPFALPLGFLALGAPAPLLAVATFVAGCGLMISNTVWESTLQRHVPDAVLSRVSAYDWFGSMAFQPLGFALWGPIAALIGVPAALWIAFVLLVLSSAAVLAVREIRELGPAPAAPV